MTPRPPGQQAGAAGPAVPPPGGATTPPAAQGFNVQGLAILKPPYGLLSAIDVNKGDLIWQVPHGDTPDVVRNHPALKGMNIPKTGSTSVARGPNLRYSDRTP